MSRNAIQIRNADLKPGMKFLVPSGGSLAINGEVYSSNVNPGMTVVETEIGSLYLSDELTSPIEESSL